MKKVIAILLRELRLHKFLLIGVSTGLLPGSHPVISVIGGLVGYFLDTILIEAHRSRKIKIFIDGPDFGILDHPETRSAAEILLFLELQEMEGFSPVYIRSPGNKARLSPLFSTLPLGTRMMERMSTSYKMANHDEVEKLGHMLKTLFLPGESLAFLQNFSDIVPGEGISSTAYGAINRLISVWGIEREKLPPKLKPLEEDETQWKILGLPPGSPPEEIRKTYRYLSGQFHPDTTGDLSLLQRRNAEEAFLKIKRAYEHLMAKMK
ncbi:MAG: J domain-containing protein [Spirochaetales bacterium]|nr:J domain-containing protein [Spirochaetales bacterium]